MGKPGENDAIKVTDLMPFGDLDPTAFKLHLATWNGEEHPLDIFVQDWDEWVGWNRWRGSRNDFSRKYVFSLIDFYHERNKWLFGGIFEVVGRGESSYQVELDPRHNAMIGRVLINFDRYQGMRGRAFYLENYLESMDVAGIFRRCYDGTTFPGFENINVRFSELQHIVRVERRDWHTALRHVKGVYLIIDDGTGRKYVGSAYGDSGIWSRWVSYVKSGHGWNEALVELVEEKGREYVAENFRFCLLEHYPVRTDDNLIIERESYWKETLLTRGDAGYNRN